MKDINRKQPWVNHFSIPKNGSLKVALFTKLESIHVLSLPLQNKKS